MVGIHRGDSPAFASKHVARGNGGAKPACTIILGEGVRNFMTMEISRPTMQ